MDAVTGLQHHRRAMNESAEKKARNMVLVKKEPEDEDAWKNLPTAGEAHLSAARARATSPLESKSGSLNSLDSAVRPVTDENGTARESQADASAPATVPVPNPRQRVRQPAQDKSSNPPTAETDLDDAARKMQELDLYAFKDSSSPASTTSTGDQQSAPKPSAAPPRTHRRHSSIPKDALKAAAVSGETRSGSGRTATATAASRRRSMMT